MEGEGNFYGEKAKEKKKVRGKEKSRVEDEEEVEKCRGFPAIKLHFIIASSCGGAFINLDLLSLSLSLCLSLLPA